MYSARIYYIIYMCVCPQYMYLRIGSSMHYCRIHIQHLPVIAACHPRRMGRWICATHGILQIQKPKKLPWRAREALEGRNGKQQLSPQELGRSSALSTAIHQEESEYKPIILWGKESHDPFTTIFWLMVSRCFKQSCVCRCNYFPDGSPLCTESTSDKRTGRQQKYNQSVGYLKLCSTSSHPWKQTHPCEMADSHR